MNFRLALLFGLLVCSAAWADITYDATQHIICVTGFSEDKPGTLQDLLVANDQAGWGVIAYDGGTQTCAVAAHLAIGKDDGISTWFRIGTVERPQEVTLIRGDLRPTQPKPTGAYRQFQGTNALWIGEQGKPEIKPVVRFDSQADKQCGLLVGDGTDLRINNAVITAATPDRKHMARGTVLTPDGQIADSTLAWLAFEVLQLPRPLERVTFEHGTVALYNGPQWATDCVFRDMDTAVQDGGCLDAILTRCRFEGNRNNWTLGCTTDGIIATDCSFGAQSEPGPTILRWKNPNTGLWQYPRFVLLRHIVVKVQNAAGEPVAGALVEVTETQGDGAAVQHGMAKTEATGRTPAPDAYDALLVTDIAYKATDEAEGDSPQCRIAKCDCRYTVRVSAQGYQAAVVSDVDPEEAWVEKSVTLQRP